PPGRLSGRIGQGPCSSTRKKNDRRQPEAPNMRNLSLNSLEFSEAATEQPDRWLWTNSLPAPKSGPLQAIARGQGGAALRP
ncbi:MAG TPA: hypothetical protein VE820_11345, partial [Sphingomicrobium sp.]|nr:hypothetical protein [Sphingomicrobium sp.]